MSIPIQVFNITKYIGIEFSDGTIQTTAASGTSSFGSLTSGTSTGQTFNVGNGSVLTIVGSGVINANQVGGINVAGNTPSHAGQLLISQPGNTTALWADPMVQGLFAPGTNVNTGSSGGAINPVLIGGQDNSNLLQNLQVDASKNLLVNINAGTVTIAANSSVNINQIAGSAVSTAATGTILVGNADGSGNKWTSNSTTFTAKFAQDINLLGTLGTAFTTAGLVDIKGSDGNVFVRQATAANLNATVVFPSAQPINHTQTAGSTLGALANYGTSPGAVLVESVNAFITNTPAVTLTSTTITNTVAENLTQVAGVALGSTAVTNFGTAPAAVAVPGVNASLFSGTTGLTNTGSALDVNLKTSSITLTVSGTVTANQGGAPWSQNLTQLNSVALGSPSAYGTSPGTVNVLGVNAFITNTPAVTLTSTTITNTVAENLTQVAGVTLGATAVTNFGAAPAATAVPGVNASLFSGTTGLTNTGSALDVNIKTSSITLTTSGTVTANQGTANAGSKWSVEVDSPIGQAAMAASVPVVIANNQSTVPVVQAYSSPVVDLLTSILAELRGLRLATVALVTEGGSQREQDFDPNYISDIVNTN